MLLVLLAGTRVQAQLPGVPGTLVVTNKTPATATIIDVESGQVVSTLPTGRGPHEVAVSDDGRLAVVANYGIMPRRTLTVIDLTELRVVRTIDLGRHTSPHGIRFLPGDSLVLVTTEGSGSLIEVNVDRGDVRRAIRTRGRGPHTLAVSPDGLCAFTANILGASVSEFDLGRGVFVRSFRVPAQPEGIALTRDRTELWVGSNATGRISSIDLATGRVTTVADGFGFPYRIVFTVDGRTALIPDLRRDLLRALDRASHGELWRLAFPGGAPEGIALSTDGRFAFLSLSAQARVAVIDLEKHEVRGYLPAGETPDGMAFTTRVTGALPH